MAVSVERSCTMLVRTWALTLMLLFSQCQAARLQDP